MGLGARKFMQRVQWWGECVSFGNLGPSIR